MKVKGLLELFRDLKGAPKQVNRAIRQVNSTFGQRVKQAAQLEMKKRKTGRVYTLGGVRHRASAVGEAPAIRPANVGGGRLYRSLKVSAPTFKVNVTANTPYAKYLEFETSLNRPFLKPALQSVQDEYIETLTDEIIKPILGK